MRVIDLFSGVGGFALAAHWVGWQTVQFVEINEDCQKILRLRFPNTPVHGDIKTYKAPPGTAEIVLGGFPCQPFSKAGKRKGEKDPRFLWEEEMRVISEVKPIAAVVENVLGLTTVDQGRAFERIQNDLESEGYYDI